MGVTPYRDDEVEAPTPRRFSRLAKWSMWLSLAALIAALGIVAWVFVAFEGGAWTSAGLVLIPTAFVLVIAAYVVEKRARARIDGRPELSGKYYVERGQPLRVVATWIFTILTLLVASCVAVLSQFEITHGRPVRARSGQRRRGSLRPRYRHRNRLPTFTGPQRLAAGVVWARAGLHEAESVSAFEQLERELEALDAPPKLRQRLVRAREEERRHARECFEVVKMAVGIDLSARTPRPKPRSISLERLATEQLLDGCYGEAYAALYAEAAIGGAAEELQPTLRLIAADEAAHAEDAWAILDWLVKVEPTIAGHLRTVALPCAAPRVLPRWLRPLANPRIGVLSPQEERRLHQRVTASVRARLEHHVPPRAAHSPRDMTRV